MNLYVVENSDEGGKLGFDLLKKAIEDKHIHVLGLATGSSPIPFYNQIIASDLDFSDMVSVNLDEYYGLGADHEQSYHFFMQQHLFNKKPFKTSYLPNGLETDDIAECARYDRILEENPIDFQILGIGSNGHIGFNEPGASFETRTQKVALTPSTIQANARFFNSDQEVPRFAYSMGIRSILDAKQIVLFAYGASKQYAIQQLFEGPMTTDLPASALQNHPNVSIIVDQAATGFLTNKK